MMTVAELIVALESMPRDLEVCVLDTHRQEVEEAAIDMARRIPPGVPIPGMHDWRWESEKPESDDPYVERIVLIY